MSSLKYIQKKNNIDEVVQTSVLSVAVLQRQGQFVPQMAVRNSTSARCKTIIVRTFSNV